MLLPLVLLHHYILLLLQCGLSLLGCSLLGEGGKVAQFFQEISIFSKLGSHMSCRGYFPHSGSFLSFRECVLWCSGVPLPPLTLVFCLLFPTLLPALLLPFCLFSGFSPFLNASTEVPQTNLAQLWPTMDLF